MLTKTEEQLVNLCPLLPVKWTAIRHQKAFLLLLNCPLVKLEILGMARLMNINNDLHIVWNWENSLIKTVHRLICLYRNKRHFNYLYMPCYLKAKLHFDFSKVKLFTVHQHFHSSIIYTTVGVTGKLELISADFWWEVGHTLDRLPIYHSSHRE